MKKHRLGKGLDSLIAAGYSPAPHGEGPEEIEITRIELNPMQPRTHMDPEALQELADSIRSAGVLQPVLVRPRGELYELVMGERRLRACRIAGLETIPAVVREVPDAQMIEFALIENVQREDLNPIEKARAVRRMTDELGLTQEDLATRLGLKRPTIANLLRLLDLPEDIQDMVSRGTLSAGHARAILALKDPDQRLPLAARIVRRGLSVRKAERLAARGLHPEPSPSRQLSSQVQRLQTILQEALGTRVEIRNRGQRGRIVVYFADNEQFERLFERMAGTGQGPEFLQA